MNTITCKELSIVKIQRKAVVLLLIANTPTIQVTPSNGRRTTVPLIADLYTKINDDNY